MRAENIIHFEEALLGAQLEPLVKGKLSTLQVNLGKRCNQSCVHCHVGASPFSDEIMPLEVAEKIVALVAGSPDVEVVDLTGGAPELNPHFARLVESLRAAGRRVIDRCNLTVLTEEGMEHKAKFLAENQVEIVASLPCYTEENVDRQRGSGTFERSIIALRLLNDLGYGMTGTGLTLDLVYNPGGAALPGPQSALQAAYKDELARGYGVRFNRLLTMVNMPICRFADQLEEAGEQDAYLSLLHDSFNPETVSNLMCRSLVSVAWNGDLFDCDFNQMLNIPLGRGKNMLPMTVFEIASLGDLYDLPVATSSHCFGCTAGAGSSCQGALQ